MMKCQIHNVKLSVTFVDNHEHRFCRTLPLLSKKKSAYKTKYDVKRTKSMIKTFVKSFVYNKRATKKKKNIQEDITTLNC